MEKKTLVGLMVAVLAVTAGARTVYDGGKALRQNATSSSITGANGETYTDENGGKWQYLRANDNLATSTVAFGKSVTAGTYRGIGGNSSGAGAPYLHVNTTGSERPVTGGEPIEPDELYVHPGDPNSANSYVVLRFTVPEDGWYSALLSAHDANKHQSNPDPNTSGAEIRLVANGKLQARSVVSLEDCTNSNVRALLTHRFDFQMPVRWMAANETLDFMVGANGGHTSDATGLKVFVTKEDEGMFYDSGIAMTNNLATVYTNVYGTAKDGTWYYLLPWVSVSTGAAFEAWAPLNFSKRISLFTNRCTRTFSSNQRGFSTNPEGKAPYMIVNETDTMASYVAPQELHTHPANIQQADSSWRGHWATLRFRAPVSGYYSASVVARDVASSLEDPNSNGVRVHLNVSDHVVASAHISGELFSSTAHLTFEPRLLVAGEPVDVVVAQASNFSSDATAFSIIIRREQDVYDAGKSFYAHHAAGNHTHPFPDVLNDGATWDLGAKTNAWCRTQFWSLPAYKTLQGTSLGWWVHSASGTQENGNLPRIVLATNGVASSDSYYVTSPGLLGTFPYEFFVHPNSANVQSSSPTLRAVVPADGIYHARGYARDLSQFDINGGGDGIRLGIAVNGLVPDLVVVSRDSLNRARARYESAADGDRLWLKAGDTLDFVVDPGAVYNGDGTGLTACYAKEGDVAAETRVVNVHFTESGSGKLSATTQRPREGWANWNTWNALRPGAAASASVKNCVEADGTTPRNVTVTLTRDSGDAIAKETPSGSVFLSHVSSSDVDDSYTFTVGNLKKNEPYALYLYGVKNSSTGGNATFTVGGITKVLDEVCVFDGNAKTLARFDVTSDANGTITGTFAAADANGGAFNGLTLVGDLPAYIAAGVTIIVR